MKDVRIHTTTGGVIRVRAKELTLYTHKFTGALSRVELAYADGSVRELEWLDVNKVVAITTDEVPDLPYLIED